MAIRRHCGTVAALVLSLSSAPEATSAAVPIGSQFQVNTYTTDGQYVFRTWGVASDSAGNFVVVWSSPGSSGSDTSGRSVQGQRYNASGSAIGGEFQVNSYTTNGQDVPSVASDSAGNFVVVWQSNGSSGSDTSGRSVQGQRYDASGSAIGGQFQVNTYTTSDQQSASIASDSAGNFVVVWSSNGSPGSDTSSISVQGQRFNASGSAIGGEFQINTYTTNGQGFPSVASDAAGNFIVAWTSDGSAGSDTSLSSVQGQRFNASGSAIGGEFQVNTYTTHYQIRQSVASDSSGSFVVVWTSRGSAGSDTSSYSIQGQRYDASGSAIGGEFQVNSYTTSYQSDVSVASDPAGNFVVAWSSNGSTGSDTSMRSVQGQRFSSTGSAIGGQFQVNTYTTNQQFAPSVASDSSGNFVVAWSSIGGAGSDTSYSSVQGQRYLPITLDAVELTCCPAGSINGNQSFNGETRAADVTVLSANAQPIGSVSVASVDIRNTSALVGARIYNSGGTLIASGNVTIGVGENQRIIVPISASLAAGGTYRVALFVPSAPSSNTGDSFDPNPPSVGGFPYVESQGLFQVNAGYQTVGDSFPANSSIAIPWGFALPEPDAMESLLAGAILIFGLRLRRARDH